MGEAAAGLTGVNRGAGFMVWGFVMGMVGTRTFGRVGNLSCKEKAVRSTLSGCFKTGEGRRLHEVYLAQDLANSGLWENLTAAYFYK
jgi:hypothetical protein